MTVIVVKKSKGKVVFSADSQVSAGGYKYSLDEFKIKKISDIITVGMGGSCRLAFFFCEYLNAKKKEISHWEHIDEGSIAKLYESFSAWLGKNYSASSYHKEDKLAEMNLIILIKNRLFRIVDNYPEEIHDYTAVGTGMFLALGALSMGADPKKAIEIACKYDIYCGGTIKTITIKI